MQIMQCKGPSLLKGAERKSSQRRVATHVICTHGNWGSTKKVRLLTQQQTGCSHDSSDPEVANCKQSPETENLIVCFT
jgi:hypothetical protein